MEMRMTYTSAIAGFLALLASSAQADTLTADEVVSLHAGECITYWGPSDGTQCFTADGVTTYDDASWGSDTGRWEMRGDEMCVEWQGEPGVECGPIWRVDADTYSDGDYTWTIN